MDKAIEAVKAKKVLRGTGDNWDMMVRTHHMRSTVQNEDLHLFASNLYVNRVSFSTMENISPLNDILTCPRALFTLNRDEIRVLRENFKVLVGRICVQFCRNFKFLENIIPKHIEHRFSSEMAEASTVIPLPIINADEKKYNDCVVILQSYEKWIYDIYKKAGQLKQSSQSCTLNNQTTVPVLVDPVQDSTASSNEVYSQQNSATNTTDEPTTQLPCVIDQSPPNQTDTQNSPGERSEQNDAEDTLTGVTVSFGGDQLTRARFDGAKSLLAGAHKPADRFDHCSPFKPAMWHTRASLLQYSYHFLHKAQSSNEKGTLKYFREKYNRRNSTPAKVLDSYEGSEELFLSVGKAYIVSALLHFFGMTSVDDIPTKNKFENNDNQIGESNKRNYFDNAIGKFVDTYVFQGLPSSEDDDFVKNYALCFIYLTLVILQMKDTAAEGDGDRNIINQKLLLSIFKSLGQYSKYAIEMFQSIAQMEVMLPKRQAEEFKWGFFTNWNGGKGRNTEDDLVQEICNRLSKEIVQRMGANKIIGAISKACKAVGGIKVIVEQFNSSTEIHKVSGRHAVRSSMDDENSMIQEILQLCPFNHVQGRKHKSFPNIKRSPTLHLNIVDFHKWIEIQRKRLGAH